jgi:hypothetical protein
MKFGYFGDKKFSTSILTFIGLKIENFGSKMVLKGLKKLATFV